MNNPNPFVPQGSLLEQQSKRRSRLKVGVFCVLAVGVTGLAAMLIQGCKREQENPADADNNPPPADTNNVAAATDTNVPPNEMSNTPNATATPPDATQQPTVAAVPPAVPPSAPVVPAAPAPTGNEYVVVRGDYMAKIAKENGVTLKALRDANPDVQPTKLKIGEKLVIPAGGTAGGTAGAETASAVGGNGDQTYVVKTGDTLTRIARHFGVTVKAIEAENNLTTTKINVGKKLQIPAKQEAAPAPANAVTTSPEPAPSAAPANPPAQPSAPAQQ